MTEPHPEHPRAGAAIAPALGPDDPLAPLLAEAVAAEVPGVRPMGLRERKKAAAMRRIQRVAVEQFEEHGFDAVTIEHIAEHAEVSPSTVYRYFGTKERLVLHDEYDDVLLTLAPSLFERFDPWQAFATALELMTGTHFTLDDLTLRRMRIWFDTPAVRREGLVVLHETGEALAPLMHAADRFGRGLSDYRVVAHALVGAFFAAIEQWYEEGATRDMAAVALGALELTRPAWLSPSDAAHPARPTEPGEPGEPAAAPPGSTR